MALEGGAAGVLAVLLYELLRGIRPQPPSQPSSSQPQPSQSQPSQPQESRLEIVSVTLGQA